MSSPGAKVYRDSRTGEYYTVDRDGNRRPADMQAHSSRPRTINPASQYATASQLHNAVGTSVPTTQERRQSGVSLPTQPRTIDRGTPTAYPASLSSCYAPTARSGPTLASPISQSPGNQWTPNTSPSVRSVQASPPNYLPVVPTTSIRSTDAALPPHAYPVGTTQSGSGAPTSTGRAGTQTAQGPIGGNGGQAFHGDGGGQLAQLQDLDASYKLRNKGFFVRGRVLMALWSEPSGASISRRGPSSAGRSFNKDVYMVAFKERAFCKVRRFVVIAESDRSCTAIAISTHCGTGATHMQQDQSQYGVVYTGSTPPPTSNSERGMQIIAVRIDPDDATTRLDATSRIHYGKLYTVEHNIKVKAYGMVNQASLAPLMGQFHRVNGQRLGFHTAPLQTLREEWTPPDVTSGPGQTAQRPANSHQLLPPQYQRAMARHPTAAAGPSAIAQTSRNNAPNVSRAPQSNAPGRGTGPASTNRRPPAPPGSVENLRQLSYNEDQIRSIRDMIGRGATAEYAMARTSALAQLGCNSEAANRIAQAVQNGTPYARAITQYRALEARATQQQASRDSSDCEQVDSGSDAEDNSSNDDGE